MTLHFETIASVARKLRSDEITSVALTQLMLDRIAQFNPGLNAFITVTDDRALEAAAAADRDFADGIDRGSLQGIPIAIKDLCDTGGVRTTGGSRLFEHRVPDADSTVVRKLKDVGAVILGKTGLHELAYGTTSANDFFGAVLNPWSVDHYAGGSSGGSAAAVAAGLAFGAVGTDTGCSIRQPAHCCGIVGYKPTFGLVSKAGVIPLCWTMDHVGPMTRSVDDARTMLKAMAGYDANDPYSLKPFMSPRVVQPAGDIKGLRIGVMRRYFFDGDESVIRSVDIALENLASAGAQIVTLDIPDIEAAAQASRAIFLEAMAIHERNLADWPEGFGDEVRSKLESSRAITATQYATAQHFRRKFAVTFEGQFEHCDVMCAPTALSAAVHVAEPHFDHARKAWQNTIISDFTGHPSVSVPCGLSAQGLPVGLMLTGALQADATLLSIAETIERTLGVQSSPAGY